MGPWVKGLGVPAMKIGIFRKSFAFPNFPPFFSKKIEGNRDISGKFEINWGETGTTKGNS